MSPDAKQKKGQQADEQKASSKAGWVVVFLMLAVIGGLVAWNPEFVTDLFADRAEPEKLEVIQAGETTGMAFLNVEGGPGQVYLDGEKLGPLPLKNRVIRSGKHRVLVKDPSGVVLLDKTLDLAAGASESLSLSASGGEAQAPPGAGD